MYLNFWLAMLVAILLVQLRFNLYKKHISWLIAPIYLLGIYFVALLANNSLRGAVVMLAEAEMSGLGVSSGESTTGGWLSSIAQFYQERSNPVLLLIVTASSIEFCAFLAAAINSQASKDTPATGLMSRWWATVVAIIGAPLIAYSLAMMDASIGRGFIGLRSEESSSVQQLDNVSYSLSPLVAVYGAPAYWLKMSGEPDYRLTENAFSWSPHYPSRSLITMDDFARDMSPWFLLCALITLCASLQQRKKPEVKPKTILQLLKSESLSKPIIKYENFRNLPWRSKYLVVGTAIAIVLTGFSLLLQILFYNLMLLLGGGWLLIPVVILFLLIAFIFRVLKRK